MGHETLKSMEYDVKEHLYCILINLQQPQKIEHVENN